MIGLGGFGFLAPLALLGLIVLPVIWWLLRLTPPAPKRVSFPAIRILKSLGPSIETAERSPPWLLMLRSLIAGLVIMAIAQPVYHQRSLLDDDGRLILVMDNGWAAVELWDERQALGDAILAEASLTKRDVFLFATAEPVDSDPSLGQAQSMEALKRRLGEMKARPWPNDRKGVIDLISQTLKPGPDDDIVWISDGLGNADDRALLESLSQKTPLKLAGLENEAATGLVLRPPVQHADRMTVKLERGPSTTRQTFYIRALGGSGRADGYQVLAREALTLEAGVQKASLDIVLPPELRNRLTRLVVEGGAGVGTQVLADEGWRRRPVGLFGSQTTEAGSPLLKELYYLNRALEPVTDLRHGGIDHLLSRPLAVMVLADPGPLAEADEKRLQAWVASGGMVLRFAGPKLARSDPEALQNMILPTALKAGDRVLGGTMSWRQPLGLGDFPEKSPFAGLAVAPDITVTRQVLARPSPDLTDKVWATLDDGTPLVTGRREGNGWTVLVHTTANTDWSTLALSGTFVEMLSRLVSLSQGVEAKDGGPPLKPLEVMDASGRLQSDVGAARPIVAALFDKTPVGPDHPPGFYGRLGLRRALNLGANVMAPQLLTMPKTASRLALTATPRRDLAGVFFTAAFLLLFIDFLVSLKLRGMLRRSMIAGGLGLLMMGAPGFVMADGSPQSIEPDASTLRLGYILTGDDRQDRLSEAGLQGLSTMARRRTAAELARPKGVNPNLDELVYYPLLYWPIVETGPDLSDAGVARIRRYLSNGGTILFDTRSPLGSGPQGALRQLALTLGLPPLSAVDANHVIGRSFYLLNAFPGRWSQGTLWVEPVGERKNDGVSTVLAGSNDWASAWAMDDAQRPLYPVVPGGERQREMAYRFGINLIMYTLTGNYKADQVHMLQIIKRLGQ